MSNPAKYTQEQLDIAVLKNTQEGILREFHGLGSDMSSLRSELKYGMSELRAEIKSQGHMNLGLVLGIYAMIGAAALAKIFGVM